MTAQRELLTSILEANLALLGVRQNDIVRSISASAAIIAVPTFLASIWGMNFTHMPELDEPWGYWVALAMMALAMLGPTPLLQADPLALNNSGQDPSLSLESIVRAYAADVLLCFRARRAGWPHRPGSRRCSLAFGSR